MTDPMTPAGPSVPSNENVTAPADTPAPDPRDVKIAELEAQLAAHTATPAAPDAQDTNDKAPPAVDQIVEHVWFDAYAPAGGEQHHDRVRVVAIEHDDQDQVIGVRVEAIEDLPLLPLAHLRY